MKRPLIGITVGMSNDSFISGRRYSQMIERAGGNPVILPYGFDGAEVLDGLLMSGGGDLDGKLGGYSNSSLLCSVSVQRDIYEKRLFDEAYEHSMPIMGICRGMQLINRFLGGTVCVDINEEGYLENHSMSDGTRHRITTAKGSLINRFFGDEAEVVSFHHQAVMLPGDGLIITAVSDEGVIEGVEHINGRILGLQTHPEVMECAAPFEWFVEMCR